MVHLRAFISTTKQKLRKSAVRIHGESKTTPFLCASTAFWNDAMTFLWVLKWKGSSVKARLCVRGFKQIIQDIDDTFASTPVIVILKLLLMFALSFNWSIECFDITTAFLHAVLDPSDLIYVQKFATAYTNPISNLEKHTKQLHISYVTYITYKPLFEKIA